MTEERIRKGTELIHKLKELEEERKLWEKGVFIHKLFLTTMPNSDSNLLFINSKYVNFTKLKQDTLDNINRLIKETQKEFDSL